MADALLVVDVQRALVDLLPQERRALFLTTLESLISHARAQALPLIYVRHHDEELIKDSPAWEIASEIGPRAGEPIVDKTLVPALHVF